MAAGSGRFPRVAVLKGGMSAEREVSLVSGRECAKALRDASGALPAGQGVATTQAGHRAALGANPGQPELLYATPSQTNLDRNTVDMDRERASFADNSVKYEATLRFINGSVRTMLDAIKGQS